MKLFDSLRRELQQRESKVNRQWRELVTAAARGESVGLAAIESSHPGNERGRQAADDFASDVRGVQEIIEAEAEIAALDADIRKIDLRKVNDRLEKAREIVRDMENQLARHRSMQFASGTREGGLNRIRARHPRVWPELAPPPEQSTPGPMSISEVPIGEAAFVN